MLNIILIPHCGEPVHDQAKRLKDVLKSEDVENHVWIIDENERFAESVSLEDALRLVQDEKEVLILADMFRATQNPATALNKAADEFPQLEKTPIVIVSDRDYYRRAYLFEYLPNLTVKDMPIIHETNLLNNNDLKVLIEAFKAAKRDENDFVTRLALREALLSFGDRADFISLNPGYNPSAHKSKGPQPKPG
ncbi:MAG: hypothetical protein PHY92_00160 [Alphaproteobacteria bacterium]|nr:hypothetical protein [Alphaproteobacteria bacterium]